MSQSRSRTTILGLTAALLVTASTFAQQKDQDPQNTRPSERNSPKSVSRVHQRASGVIIKVEPIAREATARSNEPGRDEGQSGPQRLTINTAAVWRDWVRDQAGQDLKASPRVQAERGANSVATKGEPRSEDTEVVVDLGPDTKIETRFRLSTDETSKGARTPAGANAASEDPATEKGKGKDSESSTREKTRSRDAGATRFHARDLKPGLFVEVDFGRENKDARNVASTLAVIRPVAESVATPAPAKAASKEKGNK